jgi:transcriptional regulator GlxA family with amidase domain
MRRIGFVVFPDFQLMGLAGATAFELANDISGQPLYSMELLSENGGLVRSSAGFAADTRAFGDEVFDTVVIGTGTRITPTSDGLLAFTRRALQTSRRLAAPCLGAFVLAEAGVLDGRRASTHWAFAAELRQRYPRVQVDDDRVFVNDGSIWTSAGMTASIDLALALVEEDAGVKLAREVARAMVVYHRRLGGQSQFSALLELEPKSDRIRKALQFAREHLRNELSVEELAAVANLSARQFSRAFRLETGQSPAKAVEHLRAEIARGLMEEGRLSLDVIADETGFGDRERMRRAFLRVFGQPPQAVRRHTKVA